VSRNNHLKKERREAIEKFNIVFVSYFRRRKGRDKFCINWLKESYLSLL